MCLVYVVYKQVLVNWSEKNISDTVSMPGSASSIKTHTESLEMKYVVFNFCSEVGP